MDLVKKKCKPCEDGIPPLTWEEAGKLLQEIPGWEIIEEESRLKIRRRFQFNSYMEGIKFVNKIAQIAEEEDHHPDLFVGYKKVTLNFTTHNIGGLSENDFIIAAKTNELLG